MPWARRLLPLAWYALLAVVFTWPLARDPFSHLAALHGPGDPYLNLWILGWNLDTISRAPLDEIEEYRARMGWSFRWASSYDSDFNFDFLVSSTDGRTHWLEVFKAINECLPRDSGVNLDTEDIQKRNRIRIHSINTTKFEDLKTWFDALPTKNYMPDADQKNPPTGHVQTVP